MANREPIKTQFIPFNSDMYLKMKMAQADPGLGSDKLYTQMQGEGAKQHDIAQAGIDQTQTILSQIMPYDDEDKIKLDKYNEAFNTQLESISKDGTLRSKASQIAALRQQVVQDTGNGVLGDINRGYQTGMSTADDARKRYAKGELSYPAMQEQIANAKSGDVVGKSATLKGLDALLKENKGLYSTIPEEDLRGIYKGIADAEFAKEREYAKAHMNDTEYKQWEAGISNTIEQNMLDMRKTRYNSGEAGSVSKSHGFNTSWVTSDVIKGGGIETDIKTTRNWLQSIWDGNVAITLGMSYDNFMELKGDERKDVILKMGEDHINNYMKDYNIEEKDRGRINDLYLQSVDESQLVKSVSGIIQSPSSVEKLSTYIGLRGKDNAQIIDSNGKAHDDATLNGNGFAYNVNDGSFSIPIKIGSGEKATYDVTKISKDDPKIPDNIKRTMSLGEQVMRAVHTPGAGEFVFIYDSDNNEYTGITNTEENTKAAHNDEFIQIGDGPPLRFEVKLKKGTFDKEIVISGMDGNPDMRVSDKQFGDILMTIIASDLQSKNK